MTVETQENKLRFVFLLSSRENVRLCSAVSEIFRDFDVLWSQSEFALSSSIQRLCPRVKEHEVFRSNTKKKIVLV